MSISSNCSKSVKIRQLVICRPLETTCWSKPVDNAFWQSTYNKSVDNLQQTCRQQAITEYVNADPEIGSLITGLWQDVSRLSAVYLNFNLSYRHCSDNAYDGFKNVCQQKLLSWDKQRHVVARSHPPSLLEWAAIKQKAIMAIEVNSADGERRPILVPPPLPTHTQTLRLYYTSCLGYLSILHDLFQWHVSNVEKICKYFWAIASPIKFSNIPASFKQYLDYLNGKNFNRNFHSIFRPCLESIWRR